MTLVGNVTTRAAAISRDRDEKGGRGCPRRRYSSSASQSSGWVYSRCQPSFANSRRSTRYCAGTQRIARYASGAEYLIPRISAATAAIGMTPSTSLRGQGRRTSISNATRKMGAATAAVCLNRNPASTAKRPAT